MRKFYICTYAKVGTTSIYYGIKRNYKRFNKEHKLYFSHDLFKFEEEMNKEKDVLVISGIRDPIQRNISYFFEICLMMNKTTKVLHRNNKVGDYGIVNNKKELLDMDMSVLIDKFMEKDYHSATIDWLDHFFDYLKIDITKQPFDKEKGYTFYDLENGHKLLLFKFEDLPKNQSYFEEYLNIKMLNENSGKAKWYKNKLKEFKETIKFNKEYLDKLLKNNKYMKYFYTDEEIEQFYNMYLK